MTVQIKSKQTYNVVDCICNRETYSHYMSDECAKLMKFKLEEFKQAHG